MESTERTRDWLTSTRPKLPARERNETASQSWHHPVEWAVGSNAKIVLRNFAVTNVLSEEHGIVSERHREVTRDSAKWSRLKAASRVGAGVYGNRQKWVKTAFKILIANADTPKTRRKTKPSNRDYSRPFSNPKWQSASSMRRPKIIPSSLLLRFGTKFQMLCVSRSCQSSVRSRFFETQSALRSR